LDPTVVGLTATPPYDVSHAEWQRYIELNGPVDTEISVPELVVEGDLCPHQDYVFFSKPTKEEGKQIKDIRQRFKALLDELQQDQTLIAALENHPIYQNPLEQLDWIYGNLECFSATLIYLNAAGKQVNDEHLEVIGDNKFKVPRLNYEWMEILLTFFLYKDPKNFEKYKEHQKAIANKLKRNGAIERRVINLRDNAKINSSLSSSISKLKSIEQIVDFEHDHIKEDLRMVILTDYIRKEFLVNDTTNDLPLNKIGVLPIFEQLRRTNDRHMKIGVLTGSLVIIPVSALNQFNAIAATFDVDKVAVSPLPFDDQYCIIRSNEKLKHDIVHIVTQVFQKGHIEVLIGTKSLLGEGWDAPAINALILASFVGSYVLSNQMRGRAIRTQRQNAEKTGNIWHLVCTDPTAADGGNDLQLLKRRFKAFVGISFYDEVSIENGMARLDLPEKIKTTSDLEEVNRQMLDHAGKRDELKERWEEALEKGALLVEEIKVPFPEEKGFKETKSLYYNKTIKNLLGTLISAMGTYFFEVLQAWADSGINDIEDLKYFLWCTGGLGVLLFGRATYKAARTYIKYRDISKDVHQIGEALLASLINIGSIRTNASKLKIMSDMDHYGAIYCHLEGGTTYEKSTFIKSLQETIGPVENPRYIIIRKALFLQVLSQKDYHSVPELIGRKKEYATFFERQWRALVGKCELIYTRTIEGRKILLKSRMGSLASEFEDKTERINKWQ